MSVILGIDPGSRVTGFGIIEVIGSRQTYVACGCVRPADAELAGRLGEIYRGVDEIIARYRPSELAIEQVFMARNAASALKLGHARGAAIVAATCRGLQVFEYSARQIKQAVVGTGAAQKAQVQHMVRLLLELSDAPQADAADALAAALCHAHSRQSLLVAAGARRRRSRRLC